jgi:hypothetical protein
MPLENRTLDELLLDENINLKKDNLTVIESKPIEIDNNLSHKLVYTRTDNSTHYFNLTGMEILIAKDEKIYRLHYIVDSLREYSDFLPYLEYMIDSFQIINGTGNDHPMSVSNNIIQQKKFETYTNSSLGIQIRYPYSWWKVEDVDDSNNIRSVIFFTPIKGPYLISENFVTSIDVPSVYDSNLDYLDRLNWANSFTYNTTWTKTIEEKSYDKQHVRILDIQSKKENLLNHEENNVILPINLSTIGSPNRYLLIFSTDLAFVKNGNLCYLFDMTNQVVVPPPKFSIAPASNSTTIGLWQTKNIEIKVRSFSSLLSHISFSTHSTDLLDVAIQPNEFDVPPSGWATTVLSLKDKGTGALNMASVPQTIPIIANITFPKDVIHYVLNSTIPIKGDVQIPNNEDSHFTSFTITVFNIPDYFLNFLTSLSGPVSVLVPLAGIVGAGLAWFLKRTKQNVPPIFVAKGVSKT